MRTCVLIPTYDNPMTVGDTVRAAREWIPDVIVVDDGSHAPGREACAALATEGIATVIHHEVNQGKGAACKTGMRAALAAGFTHCVQVDADGQHDLTAIPRFLAAAESRPDALVLGTPVYDDTLHKGRYAARLVTRFWNTVETLGPVIGDSMCGFRVYPLEAALASGTRGDRMNYDIEIPVRMVWNGVPVINEPVGVRYLTEEEGGISSYQTLRDTARISATHCRLVFEGLWRFLRAPRAAVRWRLARKQHG